MQVPGTLVVAGDFNRAITLNISRNKLSAYNATGLRPDNMSTAAAQARLLEGVIADITAQANLYSMEVLASEFRQDASGDWYMDLDFEVSLCKGEIVEGIKGRRRCSSSLFIAPCAQAGAAFIGEHYLLERSRLEHVPDGAWSRQRVRRKMERCVFKAAGQDVSEALCGAGVSAAMTAPSQRHQNTSSRALWSQETATCCPLQPEPSPNGGPLHLPSSRRQRNLCGGCELVTTRAGCKRRVGFRTRFCVAVTHETVVFKTFRTNQVGSRVGGQQKAVEQQRHSKQSLWIQRSKQAF